MDTSRAFATAATGWRFAPLLPSSESKPRTFGWPRTFRALRHRDFRLFWAGQTVSLIGTWMQVVAQGWLVYRLTDSPLMLGLVNVVPLLPVVPLSLLGGVISDRLPRRNLIITTEIVLMLQAFVLAILIWLDVVQVWHILFLSFILGAASAVEQPARLAFVVDTVDKEDLTNAVALNSSMYNSARILGPTIAGVLLAWIGEAGCFLVNGVTYSTVILALVAVRLPQHTLSTHPIGVADSLIDGLRYVWGTTAIRALMAIVAVSSFLTLPYIALMPVFARDVLGAGPEGLGFLMTGVGVGALAGALAVATIEEGRRGKWLSWGNIMGPIFVFLFCLSRSFPLSLALVLVVGASNAVRQTLANSLIQIISPTEYHGRVMSVFNLLFNGMSRMGALGVGAVAEFAGAPGALGLGAIVSVIFGSIVIWRMPYVYRLT
jgi:MFS family permease